MQLQMPRKVFSLRGRRYSETQSQLGNSSAKHARSVGLQPLAATSIHAIHL